MKKNLIRGVALALVLILALGLIPLAALAAEPIDVQQGVTVNKWFGQGTTIEDYQKFFPYGNLDYYAPGATIKTDTYDKLMVIGGEAYDFAGFEDWKKYDEMYANAYKNAFGNADPDSVDPEKYDKWFVDWQENTSFPFYNKNIKIPGSNASEKEINEFYAQWGNWIYAGYIPHQHKLSRWYSDGTTHWRECLVCRQYNPSHETMFMYQNWCQDGDEDQVCNVCGGHVPYHDITVIDSEGGKITVNRDNASHRMKITADVEVADGYTLHKLHFTKVRPDGSKQEVVRYEKGGQFWTNMPTYPMEVTAEFIKK